MQVNSLLGDILTRGYDRIGHKRATKGKNFMDPKLWGDEGREISYILRLTPTKCESYNPKDLLISD